MYELEDVAVAEEPPEHITWRGLFKKMDITVEEGLEGWEVDPSQLDEEAEDWSVFDWWVSCDTPNLHAFRHLEKYRNDLVTEFEWDDESSYRVYGHKYTSSIEFIEGMGANGDLYAVQASDGVALSFLQHQLNRLGSGIKIEIPPGGLY